MNSLELLDRASADFARRLGAVKADQWSIDTLNDDWNVHQLVAHVIGGNLMAVALLEDAQADEAIEIIRNTSIEGEPLEHFESSCQLQSAAFAVPGAMQRTVHHPIGDVSAEQLIGFRIGDLALHAWDLARTLGADEQLDSSVVTYLWEFFAPVAPFIGTIGLFGTGPSGDVVDDAPLQQRLLDLTGRRP